MQRRYICNGDIYATKIYMQQGYICNEETHLVESAADDDIAAGLDNCVGRAQLGPNLLAPNLVKICEGLCFVFCVLVEICEGLCFAASHLVALRVNSGDQNRAKVGLIRSLAHLGKEIDSSNNLPLRNNSEKLQRKSYIVD